MTHEKKLKFITNIVFFSIIIVLIFLFIKFLAAPLIPFAIGILFAMLLQNKIQWVSKKLKCSNKIIGIVFVLITVLVLGLLSWLLGFIIFSEVRNLLADMPVWINNTIPQLIKSITNYSSDFISTLSPSMQTVIFDSLDSIFNSLQSTLLSFAKSAGSSFANFMTNGIPNALIAFIVTIIATCFITIGYSSIREFLKRQLPPKYLDMFLHSKNYFFKTIGKMAKAYLIIIVVTFIELSILLNVCQIKYAIPIALGVAFLDILPILGVGTVLIPWAVISLLLGNWVLALELIIGYFVITVVRNFIEPKIVGDSVGLPPIATLVTMYVCLKLFGLAGMFAGVLTLIILKELHDTKQIKLWKD